MMRRLRTIAGVVLSSALSLAGCATGTPSAMPAPSASEVSSAYVIGPGDTLNINVYHVPDLSLTLPVRPDGRFSMPLVTDMAAAGKTSTQLAHDVQAKLREYVKDATVSIIITTFQGPLDRQVRVIGEATQPMALPYRDHMTLLDVMIEAKGLTRFAAGNSARIVRRNGSNVDTIPVRLSDLMRDGDISKNVAVEPGDTLIIPQTWF